MACKYEQQLYLLCFANLTNPLVLGGSDPWGSTALVRKLCRLPPPPLLITNHSSISKCLLACKCDVAVGQYRMCQIYIPYMYSTHTAQTCRMLYSICSHKLICFGQKNHWGVARILLIIYSLVKICEWLSQPDQHSDLMCSYQVALYLFVWRNYNLQMCMQ